MIIWQRWGILAILGLPLALLIGLVGIRPLIAPDNPTSGQTNLSMGIALVIAAAAVWAFERFVMKRTLDKPRPVMIQQQLQQPIIQPNGKEQWFVVTEARDPQTGQIVMRSPKSTLFFIPFFIWPYLYAVGGILFIVLGISGLVVGR
ncbi:hypothetical protein [Humidisolicoccus flavus]|uniref:hypothetical protein n=1 Tax=Humidisolicoccus flavus TaxID=3111414 RepID=UPI00324E598B